jgi:hypothetical protein
MTFKDRLLRKASTDEERACEALALPRFSFESDEHALISTERLFQQWHHDDEAQDDLDDRNMEEAARKKEEQDIIARDLHHPLRLPLTSAADHLGRAPRSQQPSELEQQAQMGRHDTRLTLHLHLALFVDDGHSCTTRHWRRV